MKKVSHEGTKARRAYRSARASWSAARQRRFGIALILAALLVFTGGCGEKKEEVYFTSTGLPSDIVLVFIGDRDEEKKKLGKGDIDAQGERITNGIPASKIPKQGKSAADYLYGKNATALDIAQGKSAVDYLYGQGAVRPMTLPNCWSVYKYPFEEARKLLEELEAQKESK